MQTYLGNFPMSRKVILSINSVLFTRLANPQKAKLILNSFSPTQIKGEKFTTFWNVPLLLMVYIPINLHRQQN